MKVKLDENLHIGLAEVFTADHDVETVADKGLLGADDATVSEGGRRRGATHHHP